MRVSLVFSSYFYFTSLFNIVKFLNYLYWCVCKSFFLFDQKQVSVGNVILDLSKTTCINKG